MAVSSLLTMGNHALLANQIAIGVVGNNISNVDTEGYSRQVAEFNEYMPYNSRAGQLGMGVEISEITRSFDRLLENTYITEYTDQEKYTVQSGILASVENIFNEANRDGISSSMTEFFNYWQSLSNFPDDNATKQALLSQADALTGIIRDTQTTLANYQQEINNYIAEDVEKVNYIVQAIAELNTEIVKNTYPGNNPNTLLDQRDQLVRELAEIVDVTVEDNGGIDFNVRLKSGLPLVEGETANSLEVKSQTVEYKRVEPNDGVGKSTGEAIISGDDAFEYTIEFLDEENFRVSLDGGKSWLKDESGNIETYAVPPVGEKIAIKDIEIEFTANDFNSGDVVSVVPKSAVYWVEPTRPPVNITPLVSADGTEDSLRLTGGSLSAYYITRDYNIGKYMDKMDALSNSLAWEVNRLYSQSASTVPQSSYYGTEAVEDNNAPLGHTGTGLEFSNRLQTGNLTLNIYDDATGDRIDFGPIDFDPTTPEIDNFDPEVHSMNDLVNAINNTPAYNNNVKAEVINGKLQISSRDGTHLAFSDDSTGILAALGVNTFFSGSDAHDISIHEDLRTNPGKLNAGQVNEAGVITAGDNTVALEISKLANQSVTIHTAWETTSQSLSSYYSRLVSLVGAESANEQFNAAYQTAIASEAANKIQAKRGVNLDEEMTDLIKFQHSYTAAAKLITTADEMLQTVLGLKQ